MDASVGKVLGPGLSGAQVPGTVNKLVDTWLEHRNKGESFSDTYDRVGKKIFSEAAYASA